MKFGALLCANLLRKKVRTTLTVGSFAVAVFLFGLLFVVRGAFNQGVSVAGADRLVVLNRVSIINPLPLSYRDKMLRIPGVQYVTSDNWFGGVYREEKNYFPQFAIDPDNQRKVFPELEVADDQWKAFVEDRTGAIVGADTAKRFGWKVGDRIPLKATIYGGDTWEFNLRGIYHAVPGNDLSEFWMQYKFLEERSPMVGGTVGWYTVKLANPDDATRVSQAIDSTFANSPFETKTETEKAFALSFAKQAGNIEFVILAIGSVVILTLLFVTANTVATSVRERIGELAVLKAIGFSSRFVLGFILGESALIALLGGSLGVLLCKGFTGFVEASGILSGGAIGLLHLSGATAALSLCVALGVGVLAGVLPAVSAMRFHVAPALRRV
jgi:putative ABC transport system permease protein